MAPDEDDADCFEPDDEPFGEKLEDDDELLWRQVNPQWAMNGVSYLAFRPTAKDKKRLSLDRGAGMSAEESFQTFTGRGNRSAGTWAVTVGEAKDVGTPAYDDSGICGLPENHASAYFGKLSNRQMDDRGRHLVIFAERRRCQFSPPGQEDEAAGSAEDEAVTSE